MLTQSFIISLSTWNELVKGVKRSRSKEQWIAPRQHSKQARFAARKPPGKEPNAELPAVLSPLYKNEKMLIGACARGGGRGL